MPPPADLTLRSPRPGDMGWVVQRHGEIYHELRGWDATFEALVAEIVAGFVRDFDASRDRCWIAEVEGRRAGSVFLTRHADGSAQLRMLIVEPWARGRGIGAKLVHECVEHARKLGYDKMVLFTSRGLDSARRLYEAEGFEMVREEQEAAWGAMHWAQWWELTL